MKLRRLVYSYRRFGAIFCLSFEGGAWRLTTRCHSCVSEDLKNLCVFYTLVISAPTWRLCRTVWLTVYDRDVKTSRTRFFLYQEREKWHDNVAKYFLFMTVHVNMDIPASCISVSRIRCIRYYPLGH
jgi:hypothetical protein